tara:strand:- start:225 stop:584 length:360 start_codon:yes stop_codon:yes gene_type:complete
LTFDTSSALQAKLYPEEGSNGKEPTLGGKLRARAVWVDERKCIGCTYCGSVATNTFIMESDRGRARAIRQDGDSTDVIQEAIDTCPVDCIQWVNFEDLEDLRSKLEKHDYRPLGLPPWI